MMFYSEEDLGISDDKVKGGNALHKLYRNLRHPELLLEATRSILGFKPVEQRDGTMCVGEASTNVAHCNVIKENVSQSEINNHDQTDQACGSQRIKNVDKEEGNAVIDVNQLDEYGNTALSYLVLHINRGLRYHSHSVPQLQHLVDLNASLTEIEELCIGIDEEYQEQVFQCLKLLLAKGADPNFIPERCPSIAHDMEWSKAYENKLLQQEGRWNLLDRGLKMDYTKFNFFDPVAVGKVENKMSVNVLHLAAWRGSARCLELLLKNGASVNSRASDGRTALHFLYQYCNKPGDLVAATQCLISQGISVVLTDSFGQAPFQSLLKHTLISRTYVKYLANSYTREFIIADRTRDHYQEEVKQCIDLLLLAGQDIRHTNKWRDGALHILLYNFSSSLEDAEFEFQVRRHYLVPYQFRIKPVTAMMEYLLEKGCQANAVDGSGRTALHSVIGFLHNLIFHEELNSVEDVQECLSVLFRYGADPNSELNYGQTAVHVLAQVIRISTSQLAFYTKILQFLISMGLDLNARDRFGKTFLHYIMQSKPSARILFENKDIEPLVILVLRSGADPNLDASPPSQSANFMFYAHEYKAPLMLLLRGHIYHHHPMHETNLQSYLHLVDVLSLCMDRVALQRVFYQYCDNGICGVFCEKQCPVFQILFNNSTQPRSLSHLCRLSVWAAAGHRLNDRLHELPLPREIRDFIYWS